MGHSKFVCLDVGQRRIGIALGDYGLKLAWPHSTVVVDGQEAQKLGEIFKTEAVIAIVIGRPRNQRGDVTEQTKLVEEFVNKVVKKFKLPIYWQDESVTSVLAEEQLKASGKPYKKEDIDSRAAAIILQDFLEKL